MESGSTGQSGMRATNLKFVAQCRGNRFDVIVRGLKGYYGLLLCPYALVKGDRLVLTPVNAGVTSAFNRLQLFARVLVPHADRGVYETVWEKLVSPPGVMVLTEYLQSNLGVCITTSHLGDSNWTDQELAYFDFASATVNFPGRGPNQTQRVDATKSTQTTVQALADSFLEAHSARPGSALPPTDQPLRRGTLTPSNPVRSGSMVTQQIPATTRAPLPEPGGEPGGRSRTFYGMEVPSDEMDLIDRLSTRAGAGASSVKPPQGGSAGPDKGDQDEAKGGLRGTVTSLIRSLAGHMSDHDPFGGSKT